MLSRGQWEYFHNLQTSLSDVLNPNLAQTEHLITEVSEGRLELRFLTVATETGGAPIYWVQVVSRRNSTEQDIIESFALPFLPDIP